VRRGKEMWPARVDSQETTRDLAWLAVPGLAAPVVSIRASTTLEVGERVWAVGAPQGLELSLSEGLISGIRPLPGRNENVLQTTAAISPGSSGGGLFDAEARLVGITRSHRLEGQCLNFAIPAEWAAASAPGIVLPAPPGPSPAVAVGPPLSAPRDLPQAPAAANGLLPPAAFAFPAQLGLLLGIDVKSLLSSAEYRTLMAGEATGLPGLTGSQQNDVRDALAEGLKKFEAQAGFSLERDVDRLVLGVGDFAVKTPSFAVVLQGRLDEARITRALESAAPAGKTPSPKMIGGRSLYEFGRGPSGKPYSALVLLDEATLLVGTPSTVEATLMSYVEGRRPLEANASLVTLVKGLDPGPGLWLAVDSSATTAMHTAMMQRSAGPRPLVLPIPNTVTATVRWGGGFEAVTEMADEATARNMADLMRGGLGALRMALAQDSATVSAYKGWTDALDVSFESKRVRLGVPAPLGGGIVTGFFAASAVPQIRASRLSAKAAEEESHGQWKSAIDHWKEAERIEPGSVEIKRQLGSALLRLRRHPEAREIIDKGLGLEPTSLSALVAFVARYEDLVWAERSKSPESSKDVRPVYPETAKQARIQGVIVLECLISPEGTVAHIKVLKGIPALDDAAVEAVRQWVHADLAEGCPRARHHDGHRRVPTLLVTVSLVPVMGCRRARWTSC
jgi:TonB family protein